MKNMKNKTTKNNMINYGIVIVLFVIVQALSSTGNLSRLLMGLLVPLCVYTIASVSLNLVVGFSGELSLGHAGFMCVSFFQCPVFTGCCRLHSAGSSLYPCNPCRCGSCSTVRCDHRYPGTSSPR